MKYFIGKKIEMSQVFKEDGSVIPVTLVDAKPCQITAIKTKEKDGYQAVQLKFGDKPLVLKEFRMVDLDPSTEQGQIITIETFEIGDQVDVIGTSKGHGFAGVVKRHGFAGSPKTHGHKDQLRMPGSIASRRQGPVAKGKRMGGRMGGEQITVKNLEIIQIETDKHQLAIKGAIPGARGSLVFIRSSES
ncbi:50S ribosomal protein L3 [Candidatus Uhrbacteria bacterium CG_4_9_14_3_um_filter_36_7]|uniref:50S ribosomal protein L3 n=1 Tax=Candidatus Uhrbacteria bacterium CG_4_9_14_3_um_filter_36_7 TaxID=1975033 RepID=A0A2M7XI09_9BACT|nr:MAG: 50S ribosomal protein L3 [Candidatus Uhrbacteria bacterium CG_4_9_14_3_um_filter_36_7]